MKIIVYNFSILIALTLGSVHAQQQIENGNFEEWEGVGATFEPKNWSSLKTSDSPTLANQAPVVLTQDAGRNGGYSVKLENKAVFGIVANGIVTNGRIHADFIPANGYVFSDATDPQWHTPLTSKPDSIVGWIKYQPASSGGTMDKGKVEVMLHKTSSGQMPYGNTVGNLVGKARYDMTIPAAAWTRFSVPFTYVSSENPDYMLLVLTSGDSTAAINGSIAWFDDLELIYNTSSTITEIKNNFKLAQYQNKLMIQNAETGNFFTVTDALGRTITSGSIDSNAQLIDVPETGIYFVSIATSNGLMSRKVVISKQ